ncbi:MAG TPA: hypothetical protein VMB34_26950 [Acetobacteraceae bacterium]|nr:hypothetical protein [Acetobacteraceae bacterium]HUB44230.1 hypothetical protein [Acetobacteraceae bacterium]
MDTGAVRHRYSNGSVPQKRCLAVDRIIRQADAMAAGKPDLVSDLVRAAGRMIDDSSD